MLQSFEYNPIVDMSPVSQNGFIDLAACLDNGFVPTDIDDSEASYNGLDQPSAVGSQPTDVFEAIRASQSVSKASVNVSSAAPASDVVDGD